MVSIKELKVGDKVRIVDEWTDPHSENARGLMDKYLSTVMTVRSIEGCSVRMEEDMGENCDGSGWFWGEEMIAEILREEPDEPDFEIDGAVFDSLFGG